MDEVQQTLNERQNTHGDFGHNAQTSQRLKYAIVDGLRLTGAELTTTQREAVDMICLKLSRICSNPNEADHWVDIAGYATLAAGDGELPSIGDQLGH